MLLNERDDLERELERIKQNWGGELPPEEEFSAAEFFGDAGDAAQADIEAEFGKDEFAPFGSMEDPRMLKDLDEDMSGPPSLLRVKDSEGKDIKINSLVGSIDGVRKGRVLGFGDDGEGNLIVRVDWQFPMDMKYKEPEKMGVASVRPDTLKVQGLDEVFSMMEEGSDDYVTMCMECGIGVVEQRFSGDEGWGICNECGAVEGGTKEVTWDEYDAIQDGKLDLNDINEGIMKEMNEELNEETINAGYISGHPYVGIQLWQGKDAGGNIDNKTLYQPWVKELGIWTDEDNGHESWIFLNKNYVDEFEKSGRDNDYMNKKYANTESSSGNYAVDMLNPPQTSYTELDESGRGLGKGVKNSGDRNVKLRDDHHSAPLTNLNESIDDKIKTISEGAMTKKSLLEFIKTEAKNISKNL